MRRLFGESQERSRPQRYDELSLSATNTNTGMQTSTATTTSSSKDTSAAQGSVPPPVLAEPRILYCLDFDGVLCDSVHETFLSGWRACKLLWGDQENNWIQAFEQEQDQQSLAKRMDQLEADFRFVRPILYVGWEAILLIRWLAVGCRDEISSMITESANGVVASSSSTPSAAATTRELVFRRFHHAEDTAAAAAGATTEATTTATTLRDYALQHWGSTVDDYKAALSKARTSWIEEDEASWLDAHGFYGGACEAVRGYLEQHRGGNVYVITTKAKEFALRLLEKQNLVRRTTNSSSVGEESPSSCYIPESHVFGLGSGPKATVLQEILEERTKAASKGDAGSGATTANQESFAAVMVEDNIATLDKISSSPVVGNRVLPVVASWGYNSTEQLAGVLLEQQQQQQQEEHRRNHGSFSIDKDYKLPYVVLPLSKESSLWLLYSPLPPPRPRVPWCFSDGRVTTDPDARAKARDMAGRGKQKDPTGCSLASILQSPYDAGKLLASTRSKSGAAAGEEQQEEIDLFDFVSKGNIAEVCFRQQRQQLQEPQQSLWEQTAEFLHYLYWMVP